MVGNCGEICIFTVAYYTKVRNGAILRQHRGQDGCKRKSFHPRRISETAPSRFRRKTCVAQRRVSRLLGALPRKRMVCHAKPAQKQTEQMGRPATNDFPPVCERCRSRDSRQQRTYPDTETILTDGRHSKRRPLHRHGQHHGNLGERACRQTVHAARSIQ